MNMLNKNLIEKATGFNKTLFEKLIWLFENCADDSRVVELKRVYDRRKRLTDAEQQEYPTTVARVYGEVLGDINGKRWYEL